MDISCPNCHSNTVRKNGSIHTGKQKYECLSCCRQFVENPQNKLIPDDTKKRIRRSLLERVSMEGICRIFDVSMPWLLEFMKQTFQTLNRNLLSQREEIGHNTSSSEK